MTKLKEILSPMTALVSQILVKSGQAVSKGEDLIILEAMKMENAITAKEDAIIESIVVKQNDTVNKGERLLNYTSNNGALSIVNKQEIKEQGQDKLGELRTRKQFLFDDNRPKAVAKRHAKNQNTARKNIALLVDKDTFKEYGSLIVAAQRTRRTIDDLIMNTPADGLVTGTASINNDLIDCKSTQCMVMAYDYTVLAGTQGTMNHVKMDRMLSLAKKNKLPTILFAEGGGGRPGDVDVQTIAGLHISTFYTYAALNQYVPTIAIVSGYCFAGNAALAGSSDIIIGTENISIGMGGPAMIEGGGLGKHHPSEVGPADVQTQNGVIDILCKDENEAIEKAKKYLGYFQGKAKQWKSEEQEKLQTIIPQNRKRTYDIEAVISILADRDSVLCLKPAFGKGLITALIRIEGSPVGLIANNSAIDAGAITSDNGIKAQEFIQLCNKGGLPILSLVDTPGIMVGPDAEKTGTVKHASRMFNVASRIDVPFFTIVLRRAYGLGAMAMMGGSTHSTDFTVAWPTGEFGAMGLEGAVKLGYRKELGAIEDLKERETLYNTMVEEAYERGKALSMATMFEIDDVIEPKESRAWIVQGLKNIINN